MLRDVLNEFKDVDDLCCSDVLALSNPRTPRNPHNKIVVVDPRKCVDSNENSQGASMATNGS